MTPRLFLTHGVFALLFSSGTSLAGKLESVRHSTDYAPSNSNQTPEEDDEDACGFWEMLISGCPTPQELQRRKQERAATQQASNTTAELKRESDLLAESLFYLPYPYYEDHPGNMLRIRLPSDRLMRVEPCVPELGTGGICEAPPIVACINSNCYQAQPEEDIILPPVAKHLSNGRAQLFLDLGRDFDGLWRGAVGAYIGGTGFFAVDTRWTFWVEPIGNGKLDSYWLGDVNVHLQLLRLPALTGSIGVGPRVLTDSKGYAVGVNASARLDLYPLSPLVLHLEGDLGNLGSALAYEAQGTAGVMLGRSELYAGASYLKIGATQFPSLFAGVRLHF